MSSRDFLDNRLKAKNRLLSQARKRQRSSSPPPDSSTSNSSFPQAPFVGVSTSTSTSTPSASISTPTATATTSSQQHQQPLPRDSRLGKYVEFDLSKLRNSKGGFLVDGERDEHEDERARKQRRQVQVLREQRLKEAERTGLLHEPSISLDKTKNPTCKLCNTPELDFQIYNVFHVPICPKCRNANPDKFSLLTKTECKEDYLLTDPELKDEELLPHLLKPNPHRSTYSNMMLFLREQVEAYAFSPSKWGSPEALDAEHERRESTKLAKKNKKFENKLRELRKRTTTNVWHRRKEASEHVHDFVQGQGQGHTQQCQSCGLVVEAEEF